MNRSVLRVCGMSLVFLGLCSTRASQASKEVVSWRWETRGHLSLDNPHLKTGEEGERYRLAILPEHKGLQITRKNRDNTTAWTRSLDADSPVEGALVVDLSGLYVAQYSPYSSGCTLIALDPGTGATRWRVEAKALGPVAHSKTQNEVQLRLMDGQLVLFGSEAFGRYVEQRSPKNGKLLAHHRVSDPLATEPWSWDTEERNAHRLPSEYGGHYVFSPHPETDRILRYGRSGSLLWEHTVKSEGACAAAAFHEVSNRVFVVHYCRYANGAKLVSLDAQRGTVHWSRPVLGLGSVPHSEYINTLQVGSHALGIAVYGRESGGHYIELFDPEGQRLSTQTFTDSSKAP